MALLQRIAAQSTLRFAPAVSMTLARNASTMAPKLNDPSLLKQNVHYINGQFVPSISGKTFKVTDPSTGELVGTGAEADVDDTKSAIEAAAEAFKTFRKQTGRERAKLLRKWFDLMNENADDIAKLITWENGKPIADAKGEAAYAANFFEWFSEEAPRTYGDTIPSSLAANREHISGGHIGTQGRCLSRQHGFTRHYAMCRYNMDILRCPNDPQMLITQMTFFSCVSSPVDPAWRCNLNYGACYYGYDKAMRGITWCEDDDCGVAQALGQHQSIMELEWKYGL
ncbi:hypothetical protein NLG97_g5671 [Lecanicillium saksenae]|uniref:Uncharacterized protein n=1 Tax=Lecanicillium saksenae TaxID=468837 RepID=A0ACC1QTN9_9HYPO|nr:hypothetical protein NLG97_g5671 [Lecanicillium saksenae]